MPPTGAALYGVVGGLHGEKVPSKSHFEPCIPRYGQCPALVVRAPDGAQKGDQTDKRKFMAGHYGAPKVCRAPAVSHKACWIRLGARGECWRPFCGYFRPVLPCVHPVLVGVSPPQGRMQRGPRARASGSKIAI